MSKSSRPQAAKPAHAFAKTLKSFTIRPGREGRFHSLPALAKAARAS